MEPTEYVLAANAALALLKVLLPEIDKLVNSGKISVDVQQAQLDTLDSIRNGVAFAKPNWEQGK